jgi:hypothetical protein
MEPFWWCMVGDKNIWLSEWIIFYPTQHPKDDPGEKVACNKEGRK